GPGGTASDASAKRVELGEPEAFRVLDHHDCGVGNIHADFDHRCRDQEIDLTFLEEAHGLVFQFGLHAAMQNGYAQVGKNPLAQFFVHFHRGFELGLFFFLDDGIDNVSLVASCDLLADEVPDFGRAFIRYSASDNRAASGWHLVEHAHIEIAVKGEGKRAWDRR